MDEEGGEQDAGAHPGAGDELAPPLHLQHGLEADEAQGVIEEVGGGEREEDEAGGEPQPLQEIAACQDVHAACRCA